MNPFFRWLRCATFRPLCLVACAGLLAAGLISPAHAAVPGVPGKKHTSAAEVALPEHLTREEVRALLSRLSDEQVRDLLLRELDKGASASAAGNPDATYLAGIHAGETRVRKGLVAAFAAWRELPALPVDIWDQVTAGGVYSSGAIVLGLILSLVIALVVERLFRRLLGAGVTRADATAGAARFGIAAVWLLRELLALAVFALAAMGVSWVALLGRESAEPLFAVIVTMTLIVRVILALSEAVIASRDPARRLVPVTDEAATSLRKAVRLFVGVLILNQASRAINQAYDVSEQMMALVGLLTSMIVAVALCALIWRARRGFSDIILGDVERAAPGDAAFRHVLAVTWPGLAITCVFGIWLLAMVVAFATGVSVLTPALASLAMVLVLPLADAGLRRLVTSVFTPKERPSQVALSVSATGELARTEVAPTHGADYRQLILRYLRIVLLILFVATFLALWDIQIGTLAESLLGTRVAGALFDISVTVLLAYAAWGLVKAAVEYHVPEKHGDEGHGEGDGGGPGASRLQTLLPLFRKFFLITLLVIAVLISLSALGVNIGPLIAGAGIVGIAIGFGAQTLVRDIVSGVFFLIDDAFRMGEYVEMGDIRGTVEQISVRSLRLRHHNGPLHTIPFGEIKHLTNYSRDWAIMKFELRVPYETDLDKVRKIIKTIGKEMLEDPELGPLMLGPLKSQGVNRMDDSALILRCKFTALPGQQFFVRREAFSRIQRAFDEAGIHFAPRRVIVQTQEPALAAAAAGTLDAEGKGKGSGKTDDRG